MKSRRITPQAARQPKQNVAENETLTNVRVISERLRRQFQGFPLATYVWKHEIDDFSLVDFNIAAEVASGGRAATYLGTKASMVYREIPHIFAEILECQTKQVTFQTEMQYTIPNTEETYDLKVTYVPLPPDLVMVHTENMTERKQAERDLQRRANEFAALYETSLQLAQQYDAGALLESIVERATLLLHCTTGAIFIYDPVQNDLPLVAWKGPPIQTKTRLQVGESIAGQVALLRQPMIVNDYQNWPYRSTQFENAHIRAGIGVPLLYAGELIGVLVVAQIVEATRQFTDREMRLLSLFGNQAASAIYITRLFNDARRRLSELEAINSISKALRNAQTLNEMLPTLLEKTLEVLKTDSGIIWLKENSHGQLRSAAARGWFMGISESPMLSQKGIAAHVFTTGEAYISHDFASDLLVRESIPLRIPEGLSGVCIAIHTGQEVVGLMLVSVQLPRELNSDEIHLLTAIAEIAGNATHRMRLYEQILRDDADLALAYESTLEGWSRALDLRDKETEGHALRVTQMAIRLARALGVPEDDLVHIRRGSLLHDIGKMGIPDSILLKPGPLTKEESAIMQNHPTYAYEMLSPISYLHPAIAIPYCHHEKWDGTGYPRGLKGEQIPLAARIFAIVDVWDALRSDRVYRPHWPEEKVYEYIQEQAGKHFDPNIVRRFLKLRGENSFLSC